MYYIIPKFMLLLHIMSIESSKFHFQEQKNKRIVDMEELPDWHLEPSTPLWEKWGEIVPKVTIQHLEKETELPYDKFPDLKEKREKIKEDQHNFNGSIANVEKISISSDGIEIETSTSRFFDYTVASNYFREKNIQKENPIRPLATQAVFLTPQNEIIFTRRPQKNVFDFPGVLSEFGGVLKPDQTDVISGLSEILERKIGLKLEKSQFQITGIDRENINNIFCVFQLVRLTEAQTESFLMKFRKPRINIAKQELSNIERKEKLKEVELCYKISAEEGLGYLERVFKHRNITFWNPTAYTNILYALGASKLRTPEQISKLVENVKEGLKNKPFEYNKNLK